ncbi:MAG: glycosyltransferase, partial [Planctomycetota bacterium]
LTLLEAMAAGLPIAATDVGGNPEVVEHGQTGLLSPRRDAGSLAVNLLRVLRDPTLRRAFGDAGRARVRERFSRRRMLDAYAGHYRAMAGET